MCVCVCKNMLTKISIHFFIFSYKTTEHFPTTYKLRSILFN